MGLVARDTGGPGGDFTPAPAGMHNAVCVDVVDLGDVESVWEGRTSWKHKCRVVWQIEDLMDDGKPYIAMQRYTVSLHENSALRPMLESWRGKKFTEEELEGFDLENLIGAPCQIQISHRKANNGKTYANVISVTPKHKKDTRLEPDFEAYTRVKDRENYQSPVRRQQTEEVYDDSGPQEWPDEATDEGGDPEGIPF